MKCIKNRVIKSEASTTIGSVKYDLCRASHWALAFDVITYLKFIRLCNLE